MKKLSFNSTLIHKASDFETKETVEDETTNDENEHMEMTM